MKKERFMQIVSFMMSLLLALSVLPAAFAEETAPASEPSAAPAEEPADGAENSETPAAPETQTPSAQEAQTPPPVTIQSVEPSATTTETQTETPSAKPSDTPQAEMQAKEAATDTPTPTATPTPTPTPTPLKASCYGIGINTDSAGKTMGFHFTVQGQGGVGPYHVSYKVTGPSDFSRSGDLNETIGTGGKLISIDAKDPESGQYTFTVTVKDEAQGETSATATYTYTKSDDGKGSGSADSEATPEVVPVTEIKVSPTTVTVEVGGETKQLTASVLPETASNRAFRWESSNAAVATVDEAGNVRGVKAGDCLIWAKALDGSQVVGSATVIVTQPVLGIRIEPSAVTIEVGGKVNVTGTVLPEDAANKGVTYTSMSNAIAVVSNDGTVTGVAQGITSIIAASVEDPTKTAVCTVTVGVPVSSVKMEVSKADLETGKSMTLKAEVSPDNATNKALSWSSSMPSVATVDSNGMVSAWSAGTTIITVCAADGSGQQDTCEIHVTGKTVERPTDPPTNQPTETPTATPTTSVPGGPSGQLATVTTEKGGLNLRSEPNQGTKSKVLLRIPQNASFIVITYGSTWCYAWYDGTYGYVMTKYLTLGAPGATPTPPVAPEGETGYVKTEQGGLNLREKPNQGSTRLLIIPREASFTIVTYGNTWCYVWYKGTYGYVMTKFVNRSGSASATDAPETAAPEVPEAPAGQVAFVKTEQGGLNLRAKASQGATRLLIIPREASFTVVTYGKSWCYVWYKGTYGYVMTKFVSLAGETEMPGNTGAPATATPPAGDGDYARVTTSNNGGLNLRAAMSTDSTRILIIPKNAYVEVITRGASWCYVAYNKYFGYVQTKFLTFMNPSAPSGSTTPGEGNYAQVTTDQGGLNLRVSANAEATRILIIPRNAYVQVISWGDTWCYVNYNNKVGYVMTKFLKKV